MEASPDNVIVVRARRLYIPLVVSCRTTRHAHPSTGSGRASQAPDARHHAIPRRPDPCEIPSCCCSAVRRGGAVGTAGPRERDAAGHRREARELRRHRQSRSGRSPRSATRRQKSSALLQQQLRAAGFQVTAGVAGIPTAFVATFGSGKPVIGIVGEFDALPGLSQEAQTAQRHAIEENGAGPRLRPQPARHRRARRGGRGEGVAGRVGPQRHAALLRHAGGRRRIRQGLHGARRALQGRRRRVSWHPGDRNDASPTSSTANITGKFRFHGVAAHAAAAPDRGRSALDAVEAMDYMVNMMREHVPQETRIHYIITRGGARAEHRARLRRGLLLRAPADMRDPRRHLGADRQRRERRGARHRHDDGARGDRRGVQRAAERPI